MPRIVAAVCASALVLLAGCSGVQKPITAYAYSSWSGRVNSKGEFERARSECFARWRVEDPDAVEIDGAQERNFGKCMQTKGWCTRRSCR